MGKFNRALVFSAPLIIYALGLWGNRQALIGTIVYMIWIFMGLDEAEYKTKKPAGRDWLDEKQKNISNAINYHHDCCIATILFNYIKRHIDVGPIVGPISFISDLWKNG